MDLESIKPMLSGLLGAVLAAVFCHWLSRWVPRVCNGKSARTLVWQNRLGIRLADASLYAGLACALGFYWSGRFADDDWRGFALGFGGGGVLALLVLPLNALLRGAGPKEAYVAYAVSQKAPAPLLYTILVLGAAAFLAAGVSLLSA